MYTGEFVVNWKRVFSTTESAFAVDRAGLIVAWNHSAEKTLGYGRSEVLGQRCWALLCGRDVFGNLSCCEGCPLRASAFRNKRISPFQVDFITAAHELRRFDVSTIMLFNAPGKEMFVHLIRSEPGVAGNTVVNELASHAASNNKLKALTPRQTEVLELLNTGMTIEEIAGELGVSVSTVRNHTQHILLKLHVHSRFEAVALGRRLGFI